MCWKVTEHHTASLFVVVAVVIVVEADIVRRLVVFLGCTGDYE